MSGSLVILVNIRSEEILIRQITRASGARTLGGGRHPPGPRPKAEAAVEVPRRGPRRHAAGGG